MFLRNEWYVVALGTELNTQPIQRWVLGEPLALFRTQSGKPVALLDRCPHRGAPLSMGQVHGETLACGYHGFTFDVTGQCVDIPGTDVISPKACVQSHPLMERWGWVFAWMGDAAHANESKLPDFSWMDKPGWVGRAEYLTVNAHHALVRDNLLDLTHARFVHQKTLGTAAVTQFPIESLVSERRVRVLRDMKNIEPSPFFKTMAGFDARVDHRQQIDFYPPSYVLINTLVSGHRRDGSAVAAEFYVLNALTPLNDKSTHYFWGLVRNFSIDDAEVTELQQKLNRETFLEDVEILSQQQIMLDSAPPGWIPLSVPNDGGCVQADRMFKKLLHTERQGAG